MKDTLARIKLKGKNYEILVDVDSALKFKKGETIDISSIIRIDRVYHDSKKGEQASEKDLLDAFGTTEIEKIAEKIIKQGEIQLPAEYREKQRDDKLKQIIDFLVKNAVDAQLNKPYTEDRIKNILSEAGINIENKPVSEQISKIIEKISKIAPIKIETKKIKIIVPAIHTGKIYNVINQYKENEEWLSNGDLSCIVNIPAGLQMDFYDKLNSSTHGSAITEEINEE